MPDGPPRWHARFANFSRAAALLGAAVETMRLRALSDLETEGLVQRFEYTWELAWKLMKDYLEAQGVTFATVTPASVLRAALAAGLIDDGDTWMQALEARNLMAQAYSRQALERTVSDIRARYCPVLRRLQERLSVEIGPESRIG